MKSFQQQPLCWILPVEARHQLRLHPGLQLLQRQLLAGGDFYKLFLAKTQLMCCPRDNRGQINHQKKCLTVVSCLEILSSSKSIGDQVSFTFSHTALEQSIFHSRIRIRKLQCESWISFWLHKHCSGRAQVGSIPTIILEHWSLPVRSFN